MEIIGSEGFIAFIQQLGQLTGVDLENRISQSDAERLGAHAASRMLKTKITGYETNGGRAVIWTAGFIQLAAEQLHEEAGDVLPWGP